MLSQTVLSVNTEKNILNIPWLSLGLFLDFLAFCLGFFSLVVFARNLPDFLPLVLFVLFALSFRSFFGKVPVLVITGNMFGPWALPIRNRFGVLLEKFRFLLVEFFFVARLVLSGWSKSRSESSDSFLTGDGGRGTGSSRAVGLPVANRIWLSILSSFGLLRDRSNRWLASSGRGLPTVAVPPVLSVSQHKHVTTSTLYNNWGDSEERPDQQKLNFKNKKIQNVQVQISHTRRLETKNETGYLRDTGFSKFI